ncbi:phosphatidylglycerophosphatase A family protein [Govanella unica]|uniref:Phosphatidylglycerophosphatase A n=1 Tax=Govanella unica TaxID=2975056 RepID=A0A9X3TY20_9PROT|nr:phosphatidylglycerophosphatase A [Govania unica]MDA5193810.1 phosphatidylglycerophosphatase A [Govania unica]
MTERPPLNSPDTLIATWFGAGYLPKAPGTWGSLAALPCGFVIAYFGGMPALLIAAILLFPLGVWAASRYGQRVGVSDPGAIVVDEVVGQWLALLPILSHGILGYALAFAAFRLFDILKPWPVGMLDRRLKGGLGVMMDDVAAGLMAAILIWGVAYVLP